MFIQSSSSFVQICAALQKWCINHDTFITNLGDWCLTGVGLQQIHPNIPYNNVTRVSDYMLTHFLLFSQVGHMHAIRPTHKLRQVLLYSWHCSSDIARKFDSCRALSCCCDNDRQLLLKRAEPACCEQHAEPGEQYVLVIRLLTCACELLVMTSLSSICIFHALHPSVLHSPHAAFSQAASPICLQTQDA